MFRDAMEEIMKAGDTANAPVEGDYKGADGLWYCGKCHTKKQTEIVLPWGVKRPMCLCKCESEKKEKEEREERLRNLSRAYRHDCFSDAKLMEWDFAHDDGESKRIINIAKKYVQNFEKMRSDGKGILFYGNVGGGKTYAAACIANAVIDRCYTCRMTNFADIANTVQGMYDGKQKFYDGLMKYDLLVIDDLLAERKTEYMSEIVYNVIDRRYRSGLPLIVTSNLTSAELRNPADVTHQRIFSRLLEMCVPVEVTGNDRRKKILKDTYSEYADLLGL